MTLYNEILENHIYIDAMKKIADNEKNRIFCCHGIEHCLDVARIAYIISLEKGLEISKDIIYITALLHDIGRSVDSGEHDIHSVVLAEKILDNINCSIQDKENILQAVSDHRKSPENLDNLSDIIRYADKISRNCYNCRAYNECYWQEERKNKNIIY